MTLVWVEFCNNLHRDMVTFGQDRLLLLYSPKTTEPLYKLNLVKFVSVCGLFHHYMFSWHSLPKYFYILYRSLFHSSKQPSVSLKDRLERLPIKKGSNLLQELGNPHLKVIKHSLRPDEEKLPQLTCDEVDNNVPGTLLFWFWFHFLMCL